MHKIGGSRPRVLSVLAAEIVGVLLLGVFFAAVLTALTSQFGTLAIRAFIL